MQSIKIQNITWNFSPKDQWDEEFLGLSYVGIPGNMLVRFIEECEWEDEGVKCIPHYDHYEMEDMVVGSDHECYNADTQIVLMHWLHDKRRNYTLDYRGDDPYWLFHDNRHSQFDVHGYEICCINSYTEQQRLLEGAEMALDHGFHIKPETVSELIKAWRDRWKWTERNDMATIEYADFYPFMTPRGIDELEYV